MDLVDRKLSRLAKLDSCAVSDAKDSLGLPPAASDILHLSGQGVLVGQVKTVRLVEGVPDPSQPKVHLGARAIVQSTDRTVIVVSHPGIDSGGWGGVLSTGAQCAGVRGVIVDGQTRDIDEARGLGCPIFARRATARSARGRVYEAATGGTITSGSEDVNDGDFVIADGSGVVFVADAG